MAEMGKEKDSTTTLSWTAPLLDARIYFGILFPPTEPHDFAPLGNAAFSLPR